MICFGVFAVGHYIRRAISGHWELWDISDLHLYRPGVTPANLLMVVHMCTSVVLMAMGPIQLIPALRRNYLQAHRWTGRVYLICALVTSTMATSFVLFYRTSRMDMYEDVGNVIFGLGMIVSAVQSYRHVKFTKNIEAHKWWSYRLFAVVLSAVLFRLITVLYLIPVKFLKSYEGSKWIYEAIYFVFFVPTWGILWMYQNLPSPKREKAPQQWADKLSNFMHSAFLFWIATFLVGFSTTILLVYDWIPSLLGIDVGQADGLEHPF